MFCVVNAKMKKYHLPNDIPMITYTLHFFSFFIVVTISVRRKMVDFSKLINASINNRKSKKMEKINYNIPLNFGLK